MSSTNIRCKICGTATTQKYITHVELLQKSNKEIRIKSVPYHICNRYPFDITHYQKTEKTTLQIKHLVNYALKNNLTEIVYMELP